jgi:hypothetical protein
MVPDDLRMDGVPAFDNSKACVDAAPKIRLITNKVFFI